MTPYDEPIFGFSRERVSTKGYIDLYTSSRERGLTKTVHIWYLVINTNMSYKILLGRTSLNLLSAIVSTPHLTMKFLSSLGDIMTVHGDHKKSRECYIASLQLPIAQLSAYNIERASVIGATIEGEDLDPRVGNIIRIQLVGETNLFPLQEGQGLRIGITISGEEEKCVRQVLIDNVDLFAWTVVDLPGVNPRVDSQRLSIFRAVRQISQKKRKLREERRLVAKAKAEKLLQVGFIKEVHYITWLANGVLVKNFGGKCQMWVDYIDLDEACTNDAYLLPSIDQLVDGAISHSMLCFLDAYLGYNQILMDEGDKSKTSSITKEANYYYEITLRPQECWSHLSATHGQSF